MNRTKLTYLGLFAAGVVSAPVIWQVFAGAFAASNAETYKQLNLFGDVFDRVRADYVEAPDEEKLIEAAISGMLTSLDPHSSYMNAKSYEDMNVKTSGEFGGLGIEVTMENGVVKVVAPIDETPASRAGLMANDLITAIDGEQVQGLALNDAVDKMRGKINTPITLTIQRPGRDSFDVKLVRDVIRVKSVKFNIENKDIGFIRISSFTQQTQEGLDREGARGEPRGSGISRRGSHRTRRYRNTRCSVAAHTERHVVRARVGGWPIGTCDDDARVGDAERLQDALLALGAAGRTIVGSNRWGCRRGT